MICCIYICYDGGMLKWKTEANMHLQREEEMIDLRMRRMECSHITPEIARIEGGINDEMDE